MLTSFTAVPVSLNLVRLAIRLSEFHADEHKDLLETTLLRLFSLLQSLRRVVQPVEVAQVLEDQR